MIRVNIEKNSTAPNSTSQSIDIQLFDNVVLNTVNNFLSYVDDGSYNHLFINRNGKDILGHDFAIQTGGYTFNSSLGGFSINGANQFDGGLQPVTSKPTITNEFNLSNLRGTLAMAKLPLQPDSASSEWFINLADNTFLDSDNGGFTVFGKMLGNGMNIIDTVAAIPAYNLAASLNNNGSFTETPLTTFDNSLTAQDITDNNLVFLNTFKHLFKITDTVDFGDAVVGSPVQKNVVITNTGITPLMTGAIDSSSITAPFSILANSCDNVSLAAGANCNISVNFAPSSTDYFISSINVAISTYGYNFPITLKTPAAKLFVNPDVINFGAQPVVDPTQGTPKQKVIRLTNKGDRDLHLASITFDGVNAGEFEFFDNCTTTNNDNGANLVPAGQFCILVVNFKPNDLHEKFAVIEIQSDDPINNTLTINITGGATDDNDGIPRFEEDAAPNNGDANNDGLPDGLQDNVVSFINLSGGYSTLVTDTKYKFSQVTKLTASDFTELPATANFSTGIFSFQLTGVAPGGGVKVGLMLPTSQSQKSFYAYGPSAENPLPHWTVLDNTSTPAVVLFGNVSLNNSSSKIINANIAQLYIVDGGDGDGDSIVNGVISFTGATDIGQSSDSNSGSVSLYWLLIMLSLSTFLRTEKIQFT